MTANGKIRIAIRGTSDEFLLDNCDPSKRSEQMLLADTALHTVDCSSLSVLEIRIVMPSDRAEQLLREMAIGGTELFVSNLNSVPDPLGCREARPVSRIRKGLELCYEG